MLLQPQRRERVEDAPAVISVISKTEIRRESNTNLGDYLKGTKGIDFTQSGIDSYNMTARGFNSSFSSRLLTLTDGRMANVPSLRLTAYNVIPVSFEDVEQIEVVSRTFLSIIWTKCAQRSIKHCHIFSSKEYGYKY